MAHAPQKGGVCSRGGRFFKRCGAYGERVRAARALKQLIAIFDDPLEIGSAERALSGAFNSVVCELMFHSASGVTPFERTHRLSARTVLVDLLASNREQTGWIIR
ncbi:MAG: hypothetical protein Q7T23_11030 [Phenylobacterium sp.]|nr:hypothetical protein [Phenylobacterium sp.]